MDYTFFELLALTPTEERFFLGMATIIVGLVSPLLLAIVISKNHRKDKELEWKRQDEIVLKTEEVAKQAKKAAELLVKRQKVLDAKTDEVSRLVAEQTTQTNDRLKNIHSLVNSQLTERIRSELSATRDTLALMTELIEARKKSGLEPTIEVLAAVKGRESRISELENTLLYHEKADAKSQSKGS